MDEKKNPDGTEKPDEKLKPDGTEKPDKNLKPDETKEQDKNLKPDGKKNARIPDPRPPELNAKAPEARVEPGFIDSEKVLAHAERRAERRARDAELAALANLALIRSGMMGGHRDRLREDFQSGGSISNEEWRQRLQRIIDEAGE